MARRKPKVSADRIIAEFLGDDGYEPVDPGGHQWRPWPYGHCYECLPNELAYECTRCGLLRLSAIYTSTNRYVGRKVKNANEDPGCKVPLNESLIGVPDKNRPLRMANHPELLVLALAKVIQDLSAKQ